MDEKKTTNVGVLDKAVLILRVFSREDTLLLPQEIAQRTHLPLPTVYRLAQALSEHGLLEKDGQHFRLGMTLMHLGALVAEGIDLRWQTLPHLRWLNERTGENAELHVRNGDTRIVLETVNSPHTLRPFIAIGTPAPLHLGAAGKVLLAWLPAVERDAYARASATRFSSAYAFDLPHLQAQLEQTRAQGWAVSDGERSVGVAAIAAPIFDSRGNVTGAMTMTAPSIRLNAERRTALIPLVCEAATYASSDLGYIVPQRMKG